MKTTVLTSPVTLALSVLLATFVPVAADLPPVDDGYEFQEITISNLPDPPDEGIANFAHILNVVPYDFNNKGQVVATARYETAFGPHSFTRFVLRDGIAESISIPGTVAATPTAINESGQIAGYFYEPDPSGFVSEARAFLRAKNGSITILPVPPTSGVDPGGINAVGVIVGNYLPRDPGLPPFTQLGYIINRSGFHTYQFGGQATSLRGINARGDMVGWVRTSPIFPSLRAIHVDRFGHASEIHVVGAVSSAAEDINASGAIVGSYRIEAYNDWEGTSYPSLGFVLQRGRYATIEAPAWPESILLYDDPDWGRLEAHYVPDSSFGGTIVRAINDHGQLLVQSLAYFVDDDYNEYYLSRAYIATPSSAMRGPSDR